MRDHAPVQLRDFQGLLDRGSDEMVPPDHLITGKNLIFPGRSLRSRYGFSGTTFGTVPGIRRIHVYKRIGEADRLLILDTNGNLWDHTNSVTPIHTDVDWVDFACITMFNRAYISPHNRTRGLPGEYVYIYEGSGTIRTIGGAAPVSAPTAADSPDTGDVPQGWHAFTVSFVTNTGFVTKPSPAVTFESAGGKKVRLTNIPTGGSNVVDRYILATKTIIDFDAATFNILDYELFFVPAGVLGDNVTTTIDVDFFDTDLVSTADYLNDQLENVSAGVCLVDLDSRLAVGGIDDEESVLRVSKKTEPESFDSVEGFVNVNPGSGGGITNAKNRRGTYYIFKERRIFVTTELNSSPIAWPINELDVGSGTTCFGIGQVLETHGDTEDRFIYIDFNGLQLFTGSLTEYPLTWKIQDIWNRVNKIYLDTCQVFINPDNKTIFISVPLDSGTVPNCILYGDYSEGLTFKTMKWSTWEFQVLLPHALFMVTSNVTNKVVFGFAGNIGAKYYLLDTSVEGDDGAFKEVTVEFAFVGRQKDLGVAHFTGIRMRVYGSGTLNVYGQALDKTVVDTLDPVILTSTPAALQTCVANIASEQASFKLFMNGVTSWFQLDYAAVMVKRLWDSR